MSKRPRVEVADKFEEAEKITLSFSGAAATASLSAASLRTFTSAGGVLFRQRDFFLANGTRRQLTVANNLDFHAEEEERLDARASYYRI